MTSGESCAAGEEEVISEGETKHSHVPLTLYRSVGIVARDK